jgi:hypothetical protein
MYFEKKRIFLIFVAAVTASITTVFEFSKQMLHPDIRLWESHFVTILFNTVIATIAVYFAIRQYSSINNRLAASIIEQKKLAEERTELILELTEALDNIKKLSGLLPICMYCKKIRDEKGDWKQIESYISEHSETEFSHGICPDCLKYAEKEVKDLSKK